MKRILAVALLLGMMVLSAGCKIGVDVTTTVLSPDEMDQEMVITMEGFEEMAGEGLEPVNETGEQDGWTTEVTTDGDVMTTRSYKRLAVGDPMFPPGQTDSAGTQPEFDLQVEDLEDSRVYTVTLLVPPSEQASPSPTTEGEELDPEMADLDPEMVEPDPEMAKFAEEMAKMMAEMFKVSWTINLPGEIVETNADIQTETGGTWNFSLMDPSREAKELKIVSREMK